MTEQDYQQRLLNITIETRGAPITQMSPQSLNITIYNNNNNNNNNNNQQNSGTGGVSSPV
jgi:hypothetical protein